MTDHTYKFHIGIDVAKKMLDVAISGKKTVIRAENNENGLNELIITLAKLGSNGLVVMEASGGYEAYPAKRLKTAGLDVAIVNAKRVRDFASASGTLAKTGVCQ